LNFWSIVCFECCVSPHEFIIYKKCFVGLRSISYINYFWLRFSSNIKTLKYIRTIDTQSIVPYWSWVIKIDGQRWASSRQGWSCCLFEEGCKNVYAQVGMRTWSCWSKVINVMIDRVEITEDIALSVKIWSCCGLPDWTRQILWIWAEHVAQSKTIYNIFLQLNFYFIGSYQNMQAQIQIEEDQSFVQI
jgi:hypothetical protein